MAVDQKHLQTFKVTSMSLSDFGLYVMETGELDKRWNLYLENYEQACKLFSLINLWRQIGRKEHAPALRMKKHKYLPI